MPKISTGYRHYGLDIIRAFAILSVLFSHLGGSAIWGVIGVELFFVLSGFLIGRILYKNFSGDFTFEDIVIFLKRRWYRTLPLYYLFLAIYVGTAIFLDRPVTNYLSSIFLMQNFAWPPLPVYTGGITWSLTVEEWFYIFLPLISYLLYKAGVRKFFLYTVIMLCAVSLFSRAIALYAGDLDFWWQIRFTCVMRFDSLMIGVLFAYAYATSPNIWDRAHTALLYFGMLGSILFIMLAIAMGGGLHYPNAFNLLCLPFLSLCLVLIFPQMLRYAHSGKNRLSGVLYAAVTWFSIHAYVLYLSHDVLRKLFDHVSKLFLTDVNTHVWLPLVYLALLGVVAHALHKYVEQPIMDRRPQERKKHKII